MSPTQRPEKQNGSPSATRRRCRPQPILYGTSPTDLEANREVQAVVMVVAVMKMAMVATPVAIVTVVRITVTVMVRESRAVVATIIRMIMVPMTVVPPATAGFGFVRNAHAGRGQCSNEHERQQGTLQHLSLLGTH